MSEDQISAEKPKVPRRTALRFAGLAGAAALSAWWLKENVIDPDDQRFQLIPQSDKIATQSALSKVEDRMAEISQAYKDNFPELAAEVTKVPNVLFRNSLAIQLEFAGVTPDQNHRISGVSGTAIGPNLIVLADHTVFPSDKVKSENNLGELVGLASSTPQLVKKHAVQIPANSFSIHRLPEHDLVIIKSHANPFVDSEAYPVVNSDWKPYKGDMVHALSFPTEAQDKSVYVPHNYPILHIRRNIFVLDGIVSGGSSGAGVVNDTGELVGVINAIGGSGARATRLDHSFTTLLDRARS